MCEKVAEKVCERVCERVGGKLRQNWAPTAFDGLLLTQLLPLLFIFDIFRFFLSKNFFSDILLSPFFLSNFQLSSTHFSDIFLLEDTTMKKEKCLRNGCCICGILMVIRYKVSTKSYKNKTNVE